jgi:hypothetical protein
VHRIGFPKATNPTTCCAQGVERAENNPGKLRCLGGFLNGSTFASAKSKSCLYKAECYNGQAALKNSNLYYLVAAQTATLRWSCEIMDREQIHNNISARRSR